MIRALAALTCAAGLLAAAPCVAQWLPPGTPDCVAAIERAAEAAAAAGDEEPLLLGDVCPEVAMLLNTSGWAEDLLAADADFVVADAFVTVARLARAYDEPASSVELSRDALDRALEEIVVRIPPPPKSLWERFVEWLDELLSRRGDFDMNWLEEWLENLTVPERWLRYVVIALGVALVLATLVIVVNELRIAGVFAGRKFRERFGTDVPDRESAPRALDLDDVRRAPLAEQPALLLALVLARLRRKAAIRDSLTHRELVAAGGPVLPDAHRAAFTSVVTAAERSTYGGWNPAPPDLEPVLASGAALVEALDAPPAPDSAR